MKDKYSNVLPLLKDLLEDAEPEHRGGIRRCILAIDMILTGGYAFVPEADLKELHAFMAEVESNETGGRADVTKI